MADSIDFPLLKLINHSRSTYGLRHQDFARYQAHCTAKVHHLRKQAGLVQSTGKSGSKDAGKKFVKKDVTEKNVTSDKQLQLLLFLSERAWASSQALLAPPTSQHRSTTRLSRAVSLSNSLLTLSLTPSVSSKLSPSTHAQILAYHLFLSGSLRFQKKQHSEALKLLGLGYWVWGMVGKAGTAVDEARAAEIIDGEEGRIRFCAYQLGRDTANVSVESLVKEVVDAEKAKRGSTEVVPGFWDVVDKLEKEVESAGRLRAGNGVELSWRGRDIPVRNAKAVESVLKVQTSLKGLESESTGGSASKKKGGELMGGKKMAAFDRTLAVLGEAEDVTRELVEDSKVAQSRTSSTFQSSTLQSLSLTHSYILLQLLSIRTRRDLLLVSSSLAKLSAKESKILEVESDYILAHGASNNTKAGSVAEAKIRKLRAKVYPGVVKVLDGVLAQFEKMKDLELVEMEESGGFGEVTEARTEWVKGLRALYLSRTYALLSSFPSSLSLNTRASLYIRSSRALSSSLTPSGEEDFIEHDCISDLLPLSDTSFSQIEKDLEKDRVKFTNEWFAIGGAKDEVEDLGGEVEGINLTGAVKKEQKEKFYDIAFNYLTAFDLDGIKKRGDGVFEQEATQGEVKEDKKAMDVDEEESEEESEEEPKEEQPTTKRGWGFGLFGGKK